MHRYRYERSRRVGNQYIELFLLIKPVIIKLERKRKKEKEKYLHESLRNINGIGPRCALLRAHPDVIQQYYQTKPLIIIANDAQNMANVTTTATHASSFLSLAFHLLPVIDSFLLHRTDCTFQISQFLLQLNTIFCELGDNTPSPAMPFFIQPVNKGTSLISLPMLNNILDERWR